jgi:hypothetical protein
VIDARQLRAEELAVVHHAADRDAAEAHAVVAALAADEARARALATDAVVGERDLERGVHRLGARVGEEHVVEPVGQPLDDLVRQLERSWVAHLERRRVVHLRDLPAHRLGDLASAVARIHAPEPGDAVEDLAAFGRPVVHCGGLRQQARPRLELPVRRERHPEGFEVGAIDLRLGGHGRHPGGWGSAR